MEVIIKDNERIDDLEYKGLKIIQNKNGFCFGIDSILLSDFAKEIRENSLVLDLGTGTGILSILLSEKTKLKKIYGIEIQEDVAEMAKRSIVMNKLEQKVEIVNENIKNIVNIFGKNEFDSIVTNPPYKQLNSGKISESENKLISRHEISADLSDFIKVSFDMLKDKGTLYMVHKPERLVDILCELRRNKLEPKIVRFVHSNMYKEPKLVLIKAIKNANKFLKIEKPLYIYNNNGTYTEEILKIYNKKL